MPLLLQVTVELKNDLAITGILHSVDQYLNIKLTNTHVQNESKYPHMVRSTGGRKAAATPACQRSVLVCFIKSGNGTVPSIFMCQLCTFAAFWTLSALVPGTQQVVQLPATCPQLSICGCSRSQAPTLLGIAGVLQMSVRNCFVRGSVVRYVLVSEQSRTDLLLQL